MICQSTPPQPGSPQFVQRVESLKSLPDNSYLPGAEINCDHEGSFSGAQFLLVGSSVRADPDNSPILYKEQNKTWLDCVFSK